MVTQQQKRRLRTAITQYANAVVDLELKGSTPPEDHVEIKKWHEQKKAILEKIIGEL